MAAARTARRTMWGDVRYHPIMFGSHLSIAGGMVNALHDAKRLKMDCVQVFTKNQRQWNAPPLKDDDRDAWLTELTSLGWDWGEGTQPVRTVSHNSYLINVASPDAANRRRSIALQRVELERCEALHIPCCVMHPGAHLGEARSPRDPNTLGEPPSRDELNGLKRIVKALDQLHRALRGYRVLTCLETTVGSGTNLGYDFAHLAYIRDHVADPDRIAFCFDTCHVTAAGYDMTADAKAKAVLDHWDDLCGLDRLRVLHVNDSIGAVGSRKDRHAHIGDGECGRSCFRAILNRPELADVPKILETPKGENDKGTPWDTVNIRRLKRLMKRS